MNIDLNTPEMDNVFEEAKLYRKSAVVDIREAVPGERIVTVMKDGREETARTAGADEYVVTNPDGEQYVIGREKYLDRYDSLGGGKHRAKGMIRAFPNPTGDEVTVMASWGEQSQGADCMCAAVVKDGKITRDRYLIGGPEFAGTYGEA